MNEQLDTDHDESRGDQDSPLDRAAAAGPLPGAQTADDEVAGSNAEPAATHDSPAGVEEQRAADPDADGDELAGPDRLTSIYGPPPGERA